MDSEFVKRSFLFVCAGGILAGVFGATIVWQDRSAIWFGLLLIVSISFFFFLKKEKEIALLCVIVGMGMVFGMWRTQSAIVEHVPIPEGRIVFEGIIAGDPEERLGRIDYHVKDIVILSEGTEESREGMILVRGDLGTDFSYGDKVRWEGTFSYPDAFETESGRIFDYAGFLKKDGIVGVVSFADGEYKESGGNALVKQLFILKDIFIKNIERVVPVPESTLALGLLLGERGTFSSDLTDAFRTAGLIHIVVLSGYNISIIAEYTLLALRKRLRKTVAISVAAIFIMLFAILVGGGATVIRASIMGLLVLLARLGSRRYNIVRALVFAVTLMVIHNPLVLTLDVSFHLSILATLGLIYGAPLFERYVEHVPRTWGMREIITATISTQIFVLPYLIYVIGEVSFVSPVANILALPVIPFIMLLALCVALVGIISTSLSYLISFLLTPLLSYVIFIAETSVKLPFARIFVPQPSVVLVLGAYGVLAFVIYKLHTRPVEFHGDTEDDAEIEDFEIVDFEIVKNN